jgi:hypothetical protein
MAAMAANVSCCGTGRKEPGRSGRRRFAELVGQLADLRLLRAAAPAERLQEGQLHADQLGALPPLGALLARRCTWIRRCCGTTAFAAGTRTESVKLPTRELFGREDATTVTLVKRPERASDDPVGRRLAAQQTLAGSGQPSSWRLARRHDISIPAVRLGGRAESERVWESSERGRAGRKDPASTPRPAGLAGAAAGVEGPPHRAGRALGGRAAARAGLAKRPGDQDHPGDDSRWKTAVPSGSQVPQNDPGVPLAKGRHGPPPPGWWCLGRPAPAPLKEARP